VSEDGWLSLLTNRDEWALIDLANPSTTPALYLSGSGPRTAWSPNGRLAFPVPDRKATPWTLQVVDARTGVSSTIGPMGLPGGGPSTVWAVDGSAILDVGYSPFRMRPIDGGRPIEGVPALAWRGARSIAQGGDSFDGLCPSGTQDPGCAGRPVLRVDRANGDQLDWWSVDDNPTDEDVVSASFSVDGRSIWLLADRVDGQRHTAVLLRSTAPHEATQVAAIDVGTHVVVSLQGFAPDDSVVAVWHGSQSGSEIVDYQVTILSVADDRSSNYALTRWAGFMPSSLVDSLISQGASR
jgi:hypothetical protein